MIIDEPFRSVDVITPLAIFIFILLVLMSLISAINWETYMKLPLEEKYICQDIIIQNSSMSNKIKTDSASLINNFFLKYPKEYVEAVANVQKLEINISKQTEQIETGFVKVGDKYVSKKVCATNPEQCEVKAAPEPPQTQTVVNKRTAEECLSAREKDWQIYCQIVYQEGMNIDCQNPNPEAKKQILDNIMAGSQSEQAKCLRGE